MVMMTLVMMCVSRSSISSKLTMLMMTLLTMMVWQVMNKIEAGKSEPRAVREVSIGTKTAP